MSILPETAIPHDGKNYQPDIPGVDPNAPEAFTPFQAPLETRPKKGGASDPLQPAAPGTTQGDATPTPAP